MGFGDATNHGSITSPIKGQVVGIAATADGKGYWIATSAGEVFGFGDATPHGSITSGVISHPIVAIAITPDGGGYWLAEANGAVFSFGDAVGLGRPRARPPSRP